MKSKSTAQSILAGSVLLGSALLSQASVLTSFETDEGFTANSRTNTAGWTFTNNGNIRVSNGTEPAKQGSLSLYTNGAGSATATNLDNWAPKEDKLDLYSFSFISPTTAFSNQGNLAWVYVSLWDETTQASKQLQFWVKYGSTSTADYRIQYQQDNGSGGTQNVFTQIKQSKLDLSDWNTLSVQFDFQSKTYSINLNDVPVVSGVALPSGWNVTGIVGTRLATPSTGNVTYYDSVMATSAIPEPSAVALGACGVFAGWVLLRDRRRLAAR